MEITEIQKGRVPAFEKLGKMMASIKLLGRFIRSLGPTV